MIMFMINDYKARRLWADNTDTKEDFYTYFICTNIPFMQKSVHNFQELLNI